MGLAKRIKTIPVSEKTYDRLLELRSMLRVKTWEEFMSIIVERFSKWIEMDVREEVKDVICNDYSEMSASKRVWFEKLNKVFNSVLALAIADEFLVESKDIPGVYVVDKSKCTG